MAPCNYAVTGFLRSNLCLKSIEFRNLPAFDLGRETSQNGTFLLHNTKPFGKGYRFLVYEITELFFHVTLFKNWYTKKYNIPGYVCYMFHIIGKHWRPKLKLIFQYLNFRMGFQTLIIDYSCRGVGPPSRNLPDQLTLFKPGGQIMPLTLMPGPPPRFKKLSTPLSCNKITKTWIQIFRQNWFDFFSNISHQMMM